VSGFSKAKRVKKKKNPEKIAIVCRPSSQENGTQSFRGGSERNRKKDAGKRRNNPLNNRKARPLGEQGTKGGKGNGDT